MDDGTAKYFFLNGIAALIMLTLAEGCRVSHPGQYTLLPKLAIEARVTMPTDSTDSVYAELRWKDDVIAFYESNNHELVWYDSASKPLPVRDSLIDVICKARYFGLLPQNYHIDELKKLVDSTLPIDLVRTDALVTDAFFEFASDIKSFKRRKYVSSHVSKSNLLPDRMYPGVLLLAHGARSLPGRGASGFWTSLQSNFFPFSMSYSLPSQ